MSFGLKVNMADQQFGLANTRQATSATMADPYVPVSLFRDKNLNYYNRNNVDSYLTSPNPHRDNHLQLPHDGLEGSYIEPRWAGGLAKRLEFRGTNEFGRMRDIQSKNTTVAPTAPQVPGVPLKDPIENKDIFWSNYNTTAGSGTRRLDASGRSTGVLENRRGIRTISSSVFASN